MSKKTISKRNKYEVPKRRYLISFILPKFSFKQGKIMPRGTESSDWTNNPKPTIYSIHIVYFFNAFNNHIFILFVPNF